MAFAIFAKPRQEKKTTSYRLTTEALDLLSRLAQRYGLNHSDMLEVMIRDKASSEAIWPPAATDSPSSPPP
jgi:hypothetical protein